MSVGGTRWRKNTAALVAAFLAACGGKQAPTPPAQVQPDDADSDTEVAPTVEVPRTYRHEACRSRVALMTHRLTAAHAQHLRIAYERRYHSRVVATSDASDVVTADPDLIVSVSQDEKWMELRDQIIVSVEGRAFLYKDSANDVATIVRKHHKAGASIGIVWTEQHDMKRELPLLRALAERGPIRVRVALRVPAVVPLPTFEAPAWARERLTVLRATATPPIVHGYAREAVGACSEAAATIDAYIDRTRKAFDPYANLDELVAAVPRSVASCGCSGVDVDALELYMLHHAGADTHDVSHAWLEFRLTTDGPTKVAAYGTNELIDQLAALTREQRTAGVALASAAYEKPSPPPAPPVTTLAPTLPPANVLPTTIASDCGAPCRDAERFLGGRELDHGKAAALYREACKPDYSGPLEACRRFGVAALHGEGVTVDRSAALVLLDTTCARGDLAACAWKRMYGAPSKQPLPLTELTPLFGSCERGDRAACAPIFEAIRSGAGGCAESWWVTIDKLCRQDDVDACVTYPRLNRHCGSRPDDPLMRPTENKAVLERLCTAGQPRACDALKPQW